MVWGAEIAGSCWLSSKCESTDSGGQHASLRASDGVGNQSQLPGHFRSGSTTQRGRPQCDLAIVLMSPQCDLEGLKATGSVSAQSPCTFVGKAMSMRSQTQCGGGTSGGLLHGQAMWRAWWGCMGRPCSQKPKSTQLKSTHLKSDAPWGGQGGTAQ